MQIFRSGKTIYAVQFSFALGSGSAKARISHAARLLESKRKEATPAKRSSSRGAKPGGWKKNSSAGAAARGCRPGLPPGRGQGRLQPRRAPAVGPLEKPGTEPAGAAMAS